MSKKIKEVHDEVKREQDEVEKNPRKCETRSKFKNVRDEVKK